MPTNYQRSSFHGGLIGPKDPHCKSCGMPDDDTVCALAAQLRRQHPEWSSRRAWDRAWISAAKGVKPGQLNRRAA